MYDNDVWYEMFDSARVHMWTSLQVFELLSNSNQQMIIEHFDTSIVMCCRRRCATVVRWMCESE